MFFINICCIFVAEIKRKQMKNYFKVIRTIILVFGAGTLGFIISVMGGHWYYSAIAGGIWGFIVGYFSEIYNSKNNLVKK